MVRRLQACRNCRSFTYGKICEKCKSTNLSPSWKGLVIINDPDSEIAKILNLKEEGKYALFVD